MDNRIRKRMHGNLLKGVAWLAVGALAIMVLESAWDYVMAGGSGRQADGNAAADGDGGYAAGSLSAYVFGDDERAIGSEELPFGFAEECFDPRDLGEVRSSYDGGVIGVVSNLEVADLAEICADRLKARGWLQVDGGSQSRSTFLKENGSLRWLFLDVTKVSDSSVAVMVAEGVRDGGTRK